MKTCEIILGSEHLKEYEYDEISQAAIKKNQYQSEFRNFYFLLRETGLLDYLFHTIFQFSENKQLQNLLVQEIKPQTFNPNEQINKNFNLMFGFILKGKLRIVRSEMEIKKSDLPENQKTPFTKKVKIGETSRHLFSITTNTPECTWRNKMELKKKIHEIEARKTKIQFDKIFEKIENFKISTLNREQKVKNHLERRVMNENLINGNINSPSEFFKSKKISPRSFGFSNFDKNVFIPENVSKNEEFNNLQPSSQQKDQNLKKINNYFELHPGDSFDQIFCNLTLSNDCSIYAEGVVTLLTFTKDQIDDILSHMRLKKENEMVNIFIKALNLPSKYYFSEKITKFIRNLQVQLKGCDSRKSANSC